MSVRRWRGWRLGVIVLTTGFAVGCGGGGEEGQSTSSTLAAAATTGPVEAPASTSTSSTLTTTTLDPDSACKEALGQTASIYLPFVDCTGEQYTRLQPEFGPGKPELAAACQFENMGPACDGLRAPSTTVAPSPDGAAPTYFSCADAQAAGAVPLIRGRPGYSPELDQDGDGVACEL